jgi:hypothetical protein
VAHSHAVDRQRRRGLSVGWGIAGTVALVELTVIAFNDDGVVRAMSIVGTIVGAIAVVFKIRSPKLPGRLALVCLAAVLTSEMIGPAAWLGWSYHQRSRQIDAMAMLNLTGNLDIKPGEHASLDVDVDERRDNLVLVLRIEDHNPKIGACAPSTRLLVTPRGSGNYGRSTTVRSDEALQLALADHSAHLHLDVESLNERDRNCTVDVTVTSAKLVNY